MSETAEINTQLDKRAMTLRSLYTTKDVLPENQEVSNNTLLYIHAAPSWFILLVRYTRCIYTTVAYKRLAR